MSTSNKSLLDIVLHCSGFALLGGTIVAAVVMAAPHVFGAFWFVCQVWARFWTSSNGEWPDHTYWLMILLGVMILAAQFCVWFQMRQPDAPTLSTLGIVVYCAGIFIAYLVGASLVVAGGHFLALPEEDTAFPMAFCLMTLAIFGLFWQTIIAVIE